MQGKDGKLIVSTDASGREINQGVEQYYEATQGNGIVLTIDEVIQSYAEKAAQRAYELNNAKRVKIIAMDPKTGDVLAMASKPDYDPNNPTKAIYPYFEARILSVIITIFFVVIYLYILKSKKNKEKIRLSIIMMFVLNILVIIGIFKMISMIMLDIGNSVEYGIITTFLVLLSNICIILTVNRIIKDYKIKNENKILRESVNKEVKNYIASSRENQKVREMYHDIKNHIICIDELYKSGNSELAGEYIQKIEGSLKKYESVRNEFNTGHIISDSILKNKKSMCDEYGINFECKVDFSRYDFLDMADFCTILSNLLDNAIEACLHVEHSDRYIKISNSIVNNFSLLIVENSKENEIKKDGSKILTSKKDKSIHGIGIDNVRSCVEKYNGDMKIDYDESNFKVRIMIPIAV